MSTEQRHPPSTEQRLQDTLRIAVRYLNQRDRTIAEVRRHLARARRDDASIEAVVQLLTDQGYLDDGRYARLFAEDKRRLEQWGSARIEQSLLGRGIDREIVEVALAGDSGSGETGPAGTGEHGVGPAIQTELERSGETELERAVSLLRRRFASPPRERRERDRALAMLLRKGYDPELALDALAAYAREQSRPGAAA